MDFTPRGPLAVGMTGTLTRKVAGRRMTSGWTILELEPGTRFAMKVTGAGYELIETITLEATAGGTRATTVDDYRHTSLGGRLLIAVSGPFIRRDLRERYKRLTALVEGDGSFSASDSKRAASAILYPQNHNDGSYRRFAALSPSLAPCRPVAAVLRGPRGSPATRCTAA